MKIASLTKNRQLWLARTLLLVSILLICGRSFAFDYVEFDDPWIFYDNPHLKPLTLQNLQWMFTDSSYNNHFYSPLLWLFYAVSGAVVGFAPHPQHMVTVALHMACAWVVFEILLVILQQLSTRSIRPADPALAIWASLLATLFWALHPLRMEAVGWIAARVHLHASLLALLSVLAYCRMKRDSANSYDFFRNRLYWIAVIFFGLSMLAFPTAMTLPLMLAVLDWYWPGALQTRPVIQKLRVIVLRQIPLVLIAAIPSAISLISNIHAPQANPLELSPLGPAEQVAARLYVIWHYVQATLFPIDLSPIYTTLLDVRASAPVYLFAGIMVAVITVVAFLLRTRAPMFWCGWVCYIILIIPFAGINGRPLYASDRYSYLASIVASAWVAWLLVRAWHSSSVRIRRGAAAFAVAVLMMFSAISIQQIGIWHDSITLFHVLLQRLDGHYYRADPMWRLAMYYADRQDLDQARTWIERAHEVRNTRKIELARLQILGRRLQNAEQNQAAALVRANSYADFLEAANEIQYPEYNTAFQPAILETYRRLRNFAVTTEWTANPQISAHDRLRIKQALSRTATWIAQQLESQGQSIQAEQYKQMAGEDARGLPDTATMPATAPVIVPAH